MKRTIIYFLFASYLSFCSKHSGEDSKKDTPQDSSLVIQAQLNQFSPSVPIKKISHLDVPTFLDVYASFLESQIVWLRDSSSQSSSVSVESKENLNQDDQSALEAQSKQKTEFFKKWGISFEDFDQFSLIHSQEIQDYLSSHFEIQKRIENLDRFLSSIQNTNASQSDEYNSKEENSIVAQTTDKEEISNTVSQSTPKTNSSPESHYPQPSSEGKNKDLP